MTQNCSMVLGLEIHMQLKTDSKMFCGCKNDPFFSDANTNVCPVCMGLPGAMPIPNLNAIKSAQIFSNALGAKLQTKIIYERKNYFYPDLPKGFQLTCPHNPIAVGGSLSGINFREIHLEEDTAKSIHTGDLTLIDFNKSGVPLLEIVTEPDFTDIDEAVEFCKEIQLIVRYLGISEADMEKGNMRLEANISVRKLGQKELPNYRVEMKNINSFSFMKKALQYELRRQSGALTVGEKLVQETRGFNETTGKTFTQRSKEEANDYRYFPEPDIPIIEIDEKWMNEITTRKILLPSELRTQLKEKGLNDQYVLRLVGDFSLYEKYLAVLDLGYSPSESANFVVNISEYKEKSPSEIDKIEKSKRSSKISNESVLLPIVETVVNKNLKVVSDYKSGNTSAMQFLIGQVMKSTQGKADAQIVASMLAKLLP
ncbi:hypothetical protein CO058_04090 [candidate division WWE3 bacterium CG_4_9_14_0_2_um_filter_35_11]|uniref:Aspartyl/glutamyl-tRNA(Asn/Gln) amidotransferase subunit B n=1 Tax=candidate division WWE3 bacterium CG_4_9_14_0_2_um_filter_35_11 TaxID=1975077 RepID=A0A2M8EKP0_UNCKA|nr:MAG: Asp-tRNA(Asn)/Glu-tRNA(Gln) amidotransferase GatCAB subunit B [candidate division WWE3 bacterium CG10_big_fil_rev_8_21_14_0_10_35_32]PJC23316.1 MAG: hypothetical protein CO058_04090 [candidate division WWE3 bacterium CG_4_9_14_0_2_um_filter_35_11]